MAGSQDFTGQNIQDTYQRVLQISSSGEVADGTGSLVPLLNVTASFAVSASHEVTLELSSSHAEKADQVGSFTANAIGQAYDTVANNGQGNIRFTELDNTTDDLALTNLTTTGTPAFSKLSLNGEGSANDPILTFGGVTGSVNNPQIGYVRGGAMFFHQVGNPDNLAITFINQNADLAATIDTNGIYRSLLSPYSVEAANNATNATNATNVDVANDTGNFEHPITFIDDTTPDGGFEALKANAGITVNPSTNSLTLGQIIASGDISSSGDLTATNTFVDKISVNTTSTTARVNVIGSQVHQLSGNANTFKITGVSSADALFVSSSGNVGIGTSDPQKKLDIAGGDIRLDNSKGIFFATTDANVGRVSITGDESSDFIQLKVDNSNNHVLRLNTTGVGIGTSSPGEKLEVVGNISASGDIAFNSLTGVINGGTF